MINIFRQTGDSGRSLNTQQLHKLLNHKIINNFNLSILHLNSLYILRNITHHMVELFEDKLRRG